MKWLGILVVLILWAISLAVSGCTEAPCADDRDECWMVCTLQTKGKAPEHAEPAFQACMYHCANTPRPVLQPAADGGA